MLLSKCAICVCIKWRFMKEQEKTPLSKIPLLGDILFQDYKMNQIENKFFFAGDIFMLQMHLKQPGFTYSAC